MPSFFKSFTVAVLLLSLSACSKPSADELFAKGNAAYEKKQLADAVLNYRLALQADENRGDIRLKLSQVYLEQRDGGHALQEAGRAADLLPNDIKAQVHAGNMLLMAARFDDAKVRAEKALALDPKNPDALILMGNTLAGMKDLDGALDQYQEALALDPAGTQASRSIGVIQFSRGEIKEAEATFRKAVEASPKSIPARLGLASFLWASQRFPDAEAVLKEALALEPANVGANRALGVLYLATGRPEKAEPYFKAVTAAVNTDQAKLTLADYYLAMKRTDEALAVLKPLTASPESFAPATLRLAAIEVGRNNRPIAMTMVRSVLEKTPKYAPARLFELRLLLMDNKVDEARAAATALQKDEPNTPAAADAAFVLASLDAASDRTDDARKGFEEALRIQPNSPDALMSLARLNLQLGNPDKAETLARQVLAINPKNPVARASIIRAYLMRNETAKAAAELATLEKEYPNAPPVQNLIAARFATEGKLDAARAIYAKVAAASPNDMEALQGLVAIDLKAGRKKEATDRIEFALKGMPPSSQLDMLAASVYASVGDGKRAEELLKKAVDKEPNRMLVYSLLGQLYVSQNRLPDARDQFAEMLKRNPRSVAASTMLGMVAEAQKDPTTAEAHYKTTLGIDPTAAVAANNLAWMYVSSNRNLDQALQLAETALKRLPEEPHVNDTAGWIYYKKGMFTQAVRCLELSVTRDPSDPAAHYHLGMSYVGIGELEKARKSLQKALSMSTTFDGADEARKTLASLGK